MSKIHQAMRRAEKDGRVSGILPSRAREEVQGTIETGKSPLRSTIHDLAPPKNEGLPVGSISDFSLLVERKITPDSRLVALSSRTYDGLRDKLRRTKADARTG